ncbi:unnamed protein product [Urochloa decumbens]|uniref:F-box domain-containing protein n=1 Tax=Urochloa decumbens TaxID=240449 RepID=A0ABC9BTT3_9POAL
MAPFNPNNSRRKAINTSSPAERGVAKRNLRKRTRGGTRSLGPADESSSQDRLSALPQDMLFYILTLVSLHDAARIAVLSKEWWHLFSECQSDTIDDKYVCPERPRLETSLRCHLWEQRSHRISGALFDSYIKDRPIRRLIIKQTLPSSEEISYWLNMLSLDAVVEEIVLEMPCPELCLPHFIFNCSSLRTLSLSNFRWPHIGGPYGVSTSYIPSWTLPVLAELTLRLMDMTVHNVMDFLRRCPALLSLSLCFPRRGGSLIIRCKNLLSLTIDGGNKSANYNSVGVEEAPKLERLLTRPPTLKLGVAARGAMPRLHTAGVFQKYGLQVVWEQLRTVALITNLDDSSEVQQAIMSLHNMPNLETFHMQMKNGPSDAKGKSTSFEKIAGGPIKCLESSLKKVVLRVQYMSRRKLEFVNFLLGAAKVLKSMLICNNRMGGELLHPESRGSPGAQVVFLQNNKYTLELNTSASNYKLADPFML